MHSSNCWEANLICARVLADSGMVSQSEDAILTNLDTNLERPRSLVHLLSLYYRTGDLEKIASRLADPTVCRDLPVPVLLRCASRLAPSKVPATVNRQLAASLRVMPRRVFGADDVVVVAGTGWQLDEAKLVLALNGKPTTIRPRLFRRDGQLVATFPRVAEFGNPLTVSSNSPTATLTLQYTDTPLIRLVLGGGKPAVATAGSKAKPGLKITEIEFDSLHLSLVAAAGR